MHDYRFIHELFHQFKETFDNNVLTLIGMDNEIGDGDLGLTMKDGFNAIYQSIDPKETDLGKLFYNAGKTMAIKVPSTMGTLMAAGFLAVGKRFKGKTTLKASELFDLMLVYGEGVQHLGKAQLGEKTFLDSWYPGIETFKTEIYKGVESHCAMSRALESAQEGYEQTASMRAKHGRAAIRLDGSIGSKDPGAYVAVLMIVSFMNALRQEKEAL